MGFCEWIKINYEREHFSEKGVYNILVCFIFVNICIKIYTKNHCIEIKMKKAKIQVKER